MPAPPRTMSSQLEQTSTILGEYMLKGWTLTDLHCDQCNVTPLMREPAAQASAANRARIQFCAKCDGSPQGRSQTTPELPSTLPQIDFPSPIDPHPPISSSTNSARSMSIRERPPSAPPNRPLPTAPISPENSAPAAPPTRPPLRLSPAARNQALPRATSPSAARRTRTSEENSELISQKILQGYSLLQASCPNPSCEGIPLIGFPRAKDGTRDPRRMCVGCGTGYVMEGSMGGMKPVTPAAGGPALAEGSVAAAAAGPSGTSGLGIIVSDVPRAIPESPRSTRRRELYETGEAINKTLRPATAENPTPSQSIPSPSTATAAVEADDDDDLLSSLDAKPASAPSTSITSALNNVTSSLALTLDRLASSLAGHTAGPDPSGDARYFIDVKLHTEAIRDVLECVERVRRVQ